MAVEAVLPAEVVALVGRVRRGRLLESEGDFVVGLDECGWDEVASEAAVVVVDGLVLSVGFPLELVEWLE